MPIDAATSLPHDGTEIKAANARLAGQSEDTAKLLAARVVLRTLPIALSEGNSAFMQEIGVKPLTLLRYAANTALLGISGRKLVPALPQIKPPASQIRERAYGGESGRLTGITYVIEMLFSAPTQIGNAKQYASVDFAQLSGRADNLFRIASAAAGTRASTGVTWRAFVDDLDRVENGKKIIDAPLWLGENRLGGEWDRAREVLKTEPNSTFWINWYQRLLDGKNDDWDLLSGVSRISDVFWDAGAIAFGLKLDNMIKTREFEPKPATPLTLAQTADELEKEINRLEGALKVPAAMMGHNKPPEGPEAISGEAKAQIENTRQAIEVVRELARSGEPDVNRASRAKALLTSTIEWLNARAKALVDSLITDGAKDLIRYTVAPFIILKSYELIDTLNRFNEASLPAA